LSDGEILLAVSKRKPHLISGVFCILIGALFVCQISLYLLVPYPLWAIPALLVSVILLFTGIWLAFITKAEYVFVTNTRIAHQRVGPLGRSQKEPVSILLSEITAARLYRHKNMSNSIIGDILIKRKGKSYLFPTMLDGAGLAEILTTELKLQRARNMPDSAEAQNDHSP